jgi:hypothetical protein
MTPAPSCAEPSLPGDAPGGFGRFTCNLCGGRTKYLPHHPEGSPDASAVWACANGHVLVWKWAEPPKSWLIHSGCAEEPQP